MVPEGRGIMTCQSFGPELNRWLINILILSPFFRTNWHVREVDELSPGTCKYKLCQSARGTVNPEVVGSISAKPHKARSLKST